MSGHTHGTWKAVDDEIVTADDVVSICHVPLYDGLDPAEWQANLCLLATAPELLAALKLVRPVLEAETKRWLADALRERNEETEGKVDGAMSFLEDVDAAIAKAEGRS